MSTRVSKNGNTYNVPTVKSTYLSKSEKVLLARLVQVTLEQSTKEVEKSGITPDSIKTVGELMSLLEKLNKN